MSEQAVATYQARFEALIRDRVSSWFNPVRETAWNNFTKHGLPTRRNEEWKYTNIGPIVKNLHVSNNIEKIDFNEIQHNQNLAYEILIENGKVIGAQCNLPPEIKITSLSNCDKSIQQKLTNFWQQNRKACKNNQIDDLNLALLDDAAVFIIKENAVISNTITLKFNFNSEIENRLCNQRIIFLLEENAGLNLVENYHSNNYKSVSHNLSLDILLAPGSNLEHFKLIPEENNLVQIANNNIAQEEGSTYKGHFIALGGKLLRNNINSILSQKNADINLNGLYLIDGRRHIDMHTTVNHQASHTTSKQFYKGILTDKSVGVFNGKIIVGENCIKINSSQQNKNLLLSNNAEINTKPELQIYADDVKAAHGASIGDLDEQALFYMQARGINKELARSLLLYAFCAEVVNKIENQELRNIGKEQVINHFDNYEALNALLAES